VLDTITNPNSFTYKLGSDLVFNFNTVATSGNATTLTIKKDTLFQGSKSSNSTQFQIAPNTTPVSFFVNGLDQTNNNTLSFSFNDTGAGTGGLFIISASPVAAVPEPFTIIGSIVGGAAALRMKKKMSKSVED
jgi:hypothetical protein